MNAKQLKKASLSELVDAYADAARDHGSATESGEYKKANKAADLLAAIYSELRRRGRESQTALLPLLEDDDPRVRLWSASHALEFAPSDGERVLVALIPEGRFLGMDAQKTLEEWRKGTLAFP